MGGEIAWNTGEAVPQRVPAIVTTGAWDPRPTPEEDWLSFDEGWGAALRGGGTRAMVDLFEQEDGEAFEREFPAWAQAVTLQADPEALLAACAPDVRREGLSDLERFPVPALLIAGEREDEDDDAAKVAAMIPNGQSVRLAGLGHPGACAASALTVPTARAFLERWFA